MQATSAPTGFRNVIGIPITEIIDKKHNIWIGISFGNKQFTIDNILKLTETALTFTKDQVLIFLPGRLHAINLQSFEGLSEERAIEQVKIEETKKQEQIEDALQIFSTDQRSRIVLATYDDVLSPEFDRRLQTLCEEFDHNNDFKDDIHNVVRELLASRGRTVNEERLTLLSNFVLGELPLFLDGLTIKGAPERFTVLLYPGLGFIDELVSEIKVGSRYKDLRQKLGSGLLTGVVDISF